MYKTKVITSDLFLIKKIVSQLCEYSTDEEQVREQYDYVLKYKAVLEKVLDILELIRYDKINVTNDRICDIDSVNPWHMKGWYFISINVTNCTIYIIVTSKSSSISYVNVCVYKLTLIFHFINRFFSHESLHYKTCRVRA